MLVTDTITMVFAAIAMVFGGIGSIVVLVNCFLQETSRSLTPFLIIAFSLCMSNLILICIQIINEISAVLGETQQLTTLLDRVSMPFLCFNLWMSTWLSVYYEIKIVTTLSKPFAWLKLKFNNILPWLIFSTGMLSLIVGFCIVVNDMHGLFNNSCNFSTENSSRQMPSNMLSLQVQVYCVFVTLSFLLTFRSVMVILYSIRTHVHHMMCKSTGLTNISLKAHYTAAKTMITLLIFNYLLFQSQVVGYVQSDMSILASVALSVLLTVCPYVLINGNSKLKVEVKATLQRVFHGLGMRSFLAD